MRGIRKGNIGGTPENPDDIGAAALQEIAVAVVDPDLGAAALEVDSLGIVAVTDRGLHPQGPHGQDHVTDIGEDQWVDVVAERTGTTGIEVRKETETGVEIAIEDGIEIGIVDGMQMVIIEAPVAIKEMVGQEEEVNEGQQKSLGDGSNPLNKLCHEGHCPLLRLMGLITFLRPPPVLHPCMCTGDKPFLCAPPTCMVIQDPCWNPDTIEEWYLPVDQ